MNYFARVTAGLEQVAWREIAQLSGATLQGYGHRRIDFSYTGSPERLLALRSVDDVYVLVGRLTGLDHTRASLATISTLIGRLDMGPALRSIAQVRELPRRPRYSVTSSHLGKRNYSRYDIEHAIEQGLREPWVFVPNRPSETAQIGQPAQDLDLRVLLEDDWALVGLRLGTTPLHRRPYKVASQPGSLKAPVAYCLALLADLQPDDIVLDPMCGAGTILIEARTWLRNGRLVGGDLQPSALAFAAENMRAVGLAVQTVEESAVAEALHTAPSSSALLYQGDARGLRLPESSVQAVITNLPWDLQVAAGDNVAAFYQAALRSIALVLAPGGRAVLLSTQMEQMQAALARRPELRQNDSFTISLFGQHPAVVRLQRE